jgi:hypothetical protein
MAGRPCPQYGVEADQGGELESPEDCDFFMQVFAPERTVAKQNMGKLNAKGEKQAAVLQSRERSPGDIQGKFFGALASLAFEMSANCILQRMCNCNM